MKKKTLFALLSLLLLPLGLNAQRVHVALNNGSLVNATMGGQDTGAGFSALWRHEQLSLSMTGADRDSLLLSGEVGIPSSVFGKHRETSVGEGANDSLITIIGGHRPSFIVVSLPKGYRITGYKMVLTNDLIGADVSEPLQGNYSSNYRNINSSNGGIMRFYETKPWKTDGTNSGSTGGSNGEGYNATYVNYIESGTNWQGGGQIGQTEGDILAKAVDTGGNFDIRTSDTRGKEYTIQRESQSDTDMGNQLYFRLVKNYNYYGITIKEFWVYFTAEGTFEADVKPDHIGQKTSLVRAPFDTNKIDIGKLERVYDEFTGSTWFSYVADSVKDLTAYNYLYQEAAVEDGKPADVAPNKHITPVQVDGQLLYALESDTYYIETPIDLVTGSGNTAPIGYRIVGAQFTPLWGTETAGTEIPGGTYHYITYTSGGTTYYLNTSGRFVPGTKTIWEVTNDNYVHNGNTYLACSGNGNDRTLSTGNANTQNLLRVNNNNQLYFTRGNTTLYLHGTTSASTAPSVTNNQNGLAAWATETVQAQSMPGFSPGAYKLKIWTREGDAVKKTIEIDGVDDPEAGVMYDMGFCNNDAIKFEIEVEEGKQALVQIKLLLQALDPYINKMDITCTDNREVLHLTQPFTADDFSVSGGKFIFYVPEDYGKEDLTFSFSNLYSSYGDETYPGGTHFGRYSFVTSTYFTPVNGNGNDGLYDNAYSPDASYVNKVITSVAGNNRFKFNNAEDIDPEGEGELYLEEYPFSVATYLATENPGDPTADPVIAPSTRLGEFKTVVLNADPDKDQATGTFYVFTADETRWNIAPTKNWQHRFYAFYRMEIELRAKTFTPAFAWTKIYDNTFYEEDGVEKEESMWGLTLDVSDIDENTGKKVQGYLTYQEIIDNIQGRGESGDDNYIASKLDPNNETGPATIKQILYIDGTPLYAIIKSSEQSNVIDYEDLMPLLSPNALLFLPENTKENYKNVAYDAGSKSFRTGGNIELTDKSPFYSPYDIQVESTNYATYTRKITVPANDKVVNATVMLPFTLSADNTGKHTNPTGDNIPGSGLSFTVNQLGSTEIIAKQGKHDYGTAYFEPVSSTTEANKPYMIKVADADAQSFGSEVSYIATQKGSLIVKTPVSSIIEPTVQTQGKPQAQVQKEAQDNGYDFTGELIKGTETPGVSFGEEQTVNFTNYASYSGNKFTHDNPNIFYFNKDNYVNMNDLASYLDLCVFPFRGFYAYEVATTSPSRTFSLKRFDISYEKPESEVTAIDNAWKSKADLKIRSDKGSMTLTATRAQEVTIYSANGICVAKVNMQGGDTQTVSMPSGVYVVNNVKIGVK